MKFETTPRFDRDWAALAREHRRAFRAAVPAFARACDGYAQQPGSFTWPAALRVRPMRSAPGIWEMTWSFSGPDGRATFEFARVEGDLRVRWRRIGDHGVFGEP
ncbi:MAG: hypothetical protein ACYC3K_13375 [Candidatus Nanopelagicales bacterium]